MPSFLIRNQAEYPRFAKIEVDPAHVTWVKQAEATGFASAELARAGFESACDEMATKARERMERALKKGNLVSFERHPGSPPLYCHKNDLDYLRRSAQAQLSHSYTPLDLFIPQWLSRQQSKLDLYLVASRAETEDLLGVFETFYARSERGWFARPQRSVESGSIVWSDSFTHAIPFTSHEAAAAELERLKIPGRVVKATSAFTEVSLIMPGAGKPAKDPLCDAISAACEARDIQGAINESAAERARDLRERQMASEATETQAPPARSARARI